MPPMTSQQFAASIKSKYPQYQSLGDDELVSRLLTKYPEYVPHVSDATAAIARSRLAAQGLTAGDVKAGRGVVTPDQIKFADPTTVNGGFLGGVGSTLKGAAQSGTAYQLYDALANQPALGTTATDVVMNSMGVPNLPAIARESYRRGESNQSRSDLYGQAATTAAMYGVGKAVPAVRSAIKGRTAPAPSIPHISDLPEVWTGPEPSGSMPVYGESIESPPSLARRAAELAAREVAGRTVGVKGSDLLVGRIAKPTTTTPQIGSMDLSQPAAYGDALVQPIRPRPVGPEFDPTNPQVQSGSGGPTMSVPYAVPPESVGPAPNFSNPGTDFPLRPSSPNPSAFPPPSEPMGSAPLRPVGDWNRPPSNAVYGDAPNQPINSAGAYLRNLMRTEPTGNSGMSTGPGTDPSLPVDPSSSGFVRAPQEILINAIDPNALMDIGQLRSQLSTELPGQQFDQALLDAQQKGLIDLHQHPTPSTLTPTQRAGYVLGPGRDLAAIERTDPVLARIMREAGNDRQPLYTAVGKR